MTDDPRLAALIVAGNELASLLEEAESTHIYDEDNGDEVPDDCPYAAARAAWRLALELVRGGLEPEAELPEDVAGPGDRPNRHGIAWIAEWRSGGASSSEPARGFAYARAWLARAAKRHGENPIPEHAIPAEPDEYVGWSWETEGGRKYAIRRAGYERPSRETKALAITPAPDEMTDEEKSALYWIGNTYPC